mmetsp:Transcript_4807/g.16050  ORF Transcript_4807/g.16050 Transcript_4807/m.16050 type:complete len:119 (+) Transcript_4807:432-788(+)
MRSNVRWMRRRLGWMAAAAVVRGVDRRDVSQLYRRRKRWWCDSRDAFATQRFYKRVVVHANERARIGGWLSPRRTREHVNERTRAPLARGAFVRPRVCSFAPSIYQCVRPSSFAHARG